MVDYISCGVHETDKVIVVDIRPTEGGAQLFFDILCQFEIIQTLQKLCLCNRFILVPPEDFERHLDALIYREIEKQPSHLLDILDLLDILGRPSKQTFPHATKVINQKLNGIFFTTLMTFIIIPRIITIRKFIY